MSQTFRAPGRVNLIGEHTDYNLGFVLPIALDLATEVTVHPPSAAGEFRVNSKEYADTAVWPARARVLAAAARVDGLCHRCCPATAEARIGNSSPQQLSISSTVPEGAGLSSSAALEVSTALALLNGRAMEPLELARLCQAAEREFVGMPAGIMDQYISVFGQENAAILIDCRSLTHELVELPQNVVILAVNSMVKHDLGQSAYRDRVDECAMAADALKVPSLRDATLAQLESTPLPNVVMRRARHIITENSRVTLFVKAARRGDLKRMGSSSTSPM